jgi:NAD-dependent DNA ligase
MARSYTLYPEAIPLDNHGQPAVFIGANWDNFVSKAFDQLKGICHGILADGVISDIEASYFRDWVTANSAVETTWPFSEIAARVGAIFADGVVTDEERQELSEIMREITGGGFLPVVGLDDTSSALPLCKPAPEPIIFADREYCVTGRFAFGTRKRVVDAIAERGGTFNSNPRRGTSYLVIGHFCSRDWKYTSYGTKIERAVELRDGHSGIAIISEETWTRALAVA